ncbi:MAG: transketolase, partial [Candidatus Hodarchaeales archaeon]
MVHDPQLVKQLEEKARIIRKNCVQIFEGSRRGHLGGTMSIVDVITALYFHHLKIDPKNPDWSDRD